jgi:hypothetical protein
MKIIKLIESHLVIVGAIVTLISTVLTILLV